jgi:hypothetical protein
MEEDIRQQAIQEPRLEVIREQEIQEYTVVRPVEGPFL